VTQEPLLGFLDRIQRFYDSLEQIIVGQRLRCLVCGRTQTAEARYWKEGWPVCHDRTMRLEDIP